jgi:ATP-dependent exoDNAse (exonuclease V) beta subunit
VAGAAAPSIHVMTVSEAADRLELPEVASIAVTVETVPGTGRRPGGARFGTLVHAILADVLLANPSFDLVTRLATAHGRVLGAMPEEVEIAIETVGRVLEHPILKRATRAGVSGRCHRETPITYRTDAGVLVEGVVDVVFEEDDRLTVVDFKTDRTLEAMEAGYRRQVQIYAAAIAAATGKPASGVLMRIG